MAFDYYHRMSDKLTLMVVFASALLMGWTATNSFQPHRTNDIYNGSLPSDMSAERINTQQPPPYQIGVGGGPANGETKPKLNDESVKTPSEITPTIPQEIYR